MRQENLDSLEVKLAENGVIVLQAKVRHVHLHLFFVWLMVLTELLANLEETLFDLFLDVWRKLLLHVLDF